MSIVLMGVGSACSALGGDDDRPGRRHRRASSRRRCPGTRSARCRSPTRPTATAFAELVAPLDDVPVAVEVAGVEQPEEAEEPAPRRRRSPGSGTSPTPRVEYETTVALVPAEDGWQVDWTPEALAPELAEGDTLGLRTLAPQRGDITGAGGAVLVTERPVLRYGLDKTKVEGPQVARSARRIARILDVDPAAYVERAEAMGPEAFVEAVVLREDDALEVLPAFRQVRGALAVRDTLPLAPDPGVRRRPARARRSGHGRAGRGVRGPHRRRRRGGAVRAAGALRRAAPRQCRHSRRRARRATTSCAPSSRSRPTDGADLVTTLDPALQQRGRGRAGHPRRRRPGQRARRHPALGRRRPRDRQRRGRGRGGPRRRPGSTPRARPSRWSARWRCCAAAWRSTTCVSCPATTVVDGRSFKNYDDYPASSLGEITFIQAIAQSCNTALIGNADRLASGDLAAAAQALGLGTDHDLGFPVYFGQVPPPRPRPVPRPT